MSTNRWRNHHAIMRNQILSFIIEFFATHGYSPSYREIGDATHIRSTSTVGKYVRELIAEGALSSDRSKARTLALAPRRNPARSCSSAFAYRPPTAADCTWIVY